MTRRILLRPRAERDIDDHFFHIAAERPRTAARFLEAVRRCLEVIAEHPEIGAPRAFGSAQVRVWPVAGFPNHLVFYRIEGASIGVIRILHAARDLGPALSEDDPDA